MTDHIISWLIQTGLAALAVAGLLSTKFGERLIGFRFERALLRQRESHDKQIEELKERLSHFGDRGKRSNEMEFQAIKMVWEAFVEAWLSTNSAAILSIEIPDFNHLKDENLDQFLLDQGVSPLQAKELRESKDRDKTYSRMLTWKLIARAGREINDARVLLRKQGIFMPRDLHDIFEEGINSMTMAFVGRRLQFQNPRAFQEDVITQYLSTNIETYDRTAKAANIRLSRSESAASSPSPVAQSTSL
jgi:hypothetical protein